MNISEYSGVGTQISGKYLGNILETLIYDTIWLFNIAMERSTMLFLGNHLYMGHLFHGELLNKQRL